MIARSSAGEFTVGLPESSPVDEFSVTPAGRVPETSDQTRAPVPPTASIGSLL